MAHLLRIPPIGVPVHLIQLGINRQTCFTALRKHYYSAYVGWLKGNSMKCDVMCVFIRGC